ncbi:MAG: hypothetical protein NTW54_04400 [Bacteroidetes bacterium]|nr:hypothetical protein [Bacteroidota bacterium]
MRYLILFMLLFANSKYSIGQYYCRQTDANATPREHEADITNMKLEVEFKPEAGLVIGKVTHTFKSLRPQIDSLFFDAPEINIKAALMDGKAVPYTIGSTGVTVAFTQKPKWDETHSLTFEYEAYPKKGIYFIGWNTYDSLDKRNKTRRQIWTQGQGVDNRYWIPMYDNMNDKFTTETIIKFKKQFNVLSNGALKSVKSLPDGTKVWNYSMSKPHAGYLLMLAIDEYAIKTTQTILVLPRIPRKSRTY